MNAYELYSCLKKLDMWPRAAKQKWAHQVIDAYHLHDQYVPRHITTLIDEVLSGLPSFKYNHNHDPNNGQFTSEPSDNVIDDPPIQPVYPVETVLTAMLGGKALVAAREALGIAEETGTAEKATAETNLTDHGYVRAIERGISDEEAGEAVQTAKESGNVTTQKGKYGTPQQVYTGSNGVTVVVETAGRNAGKIITMWRN